MFLSHQGLSTREVSRKFDQVGVTSTPALAEPTPEEAAALCGGPVELRHCLVDDSQAPTLHLHPEVVGAIGAARDAGALTVTLSGSGPTATTLVRDVEHVYALVATLSGAPTVTCATPTRGPVCGACIESTEAT